MVRYAKEHGNKPATREFTAPWNNIKRTAFNIFIEDNLQAKHVCIPPGAKTWQSDVETAHRIIEEEMY